MLPQGRGQPLFNAQKIGTTLVIQESWCQRDQDTQPICRFGRNQAACPVWRRLLNDAIDLASVLLFVVAQDSRVGTFPGRPHLLGLEDGEECDQDHQNRSEDKALHEEGLEITDGFIANFAVKNVNDNGRVELLPMASKEGEMRHGH